jgi:CBS domain containing-hemolysin-like protein
MPTSLPTLPADAPAGSPAILLTYVAVALVVSFLCSVWEAVLLATPPSHIQLLAQAGSRGGLALQRLRRQVDRPITAILTLNTVAHTVGAAGAGAEATALLGSAWFGVVSAVLTLLILVFSEIIPKTLGTVHCRRLAPMTGLCVAALVTALGPFIRCMELLTGLIRRRKGAPSVTRADLAAMAALGAEEGSINAAERRTFENLLRLGRMKVRDVMTPRPVMMMLPERLTVRELLAGGDMPPFSRIPITPGDADDVRAYVLKQDVLERAARGELDVTLRELGRPLDIVPLNGSVAQALDRLADAREHILLVVDEFGGTSGLITLEDAMETLLGREIMDESDRVADLQALARRRRDMESERVRALHGGAGRPGPADGPAAPSP